MTSSTENTKSSRDADPRAAVVGGTDHHMQVDRVSDRPCRVLIVVANPAVASNTGRPVGFWAVLAAVGV